MKKKKQAGCEGAKSEKTDDDDDDDGEDEEETCSVLVSGMEPQEGFAENQQAESTRSDKPMLNHGAQEDDENIQAALRGAGSDTTSRPFEHATVSS